MGLVFSGLVVRLWLVFSAVSNVMHALFECGSNAPQLGPDFTSLASDSDSSTAHTSADCADRYFGNQLCGELAHFLGYGAASGHGCIFGTLYVAADQLAKHLTGHFRQAVEQIIQRDLADVDFMEQIFQRTCKLRGLFDGLPDASQFVLEPLVRAYGCIFAHLQRVFRRLLSLFEEMQQLILELHQALH